MTLTVKVIHCSSDAIVNISSRVVSIVIIKKHKQNN